MPRYVIMCLKFINICLKYSQITISTFAMQTQTNFCLCFTKVIFFSVTPILSLIPLVGLSPNTKSFFMIGVR